MTIEYNGENKLKSLTLVNIVKRLISVSASKNGTITIYRDDGGVITYTPDEFSTLNNTYFKGTGVRAVPIEKPKVNHVS